MPEATKWSWNTNHSKQSLGGLDIIGRLSKVRQHFINNLKIYCPVGA